MNEISRINNTAFRSYTAQAGGVTNPIDNKPREFDKDFYIDSKGAEAIKANCFVSSPLTITKPVSMNDYKSKLDHAGMIEGKDFDIIKRDDGGASIFVENKDGNSSKAIFWSGGTEADNFDGYQDVSRPINRPDIDETVLTYDRNNILEMKETRYRNALEHKELFPQNINIDTTAKDYVQILEKNNANFEFEESDDNGIKNAVIAEKDSGGNLIKMTSFANYPDGTTFINQSHNPDKKGNLTSGISILKDGNYTDLTVSEYVKDLGISGNIKC